NLKDNLLTGAIPPSLSALKAMQTLDIRNNKLSGTIPSQLSALTNLDGLYLSNNTLTGAIPSQLKTLTNLRFLFIDKNALTGSVPATISSFASLIYLLLACSPGLACHPPFPHHFPPPFENSQKSLQYALPVTHPFHIPFRLLPSRLPPTHPPPPSQACVSQQALRLLDCRPRLASHPPTLSISLSASLPHTSPLSPLPRSASNNKLSGSLPAGLSSLAALQYLSVTTSPNRLSLSLALLGFEAPQKQIALFSLPCSPLLSCRGLANNTLTGLIPSALSSLGSLAIMFLHHNSLTGSLPLPLSELTSLFSV
ncbi:unnamed protein product, partial [Closterium sp. NIES-65]